MSDNIRNYYEILGIKPSASNDDIKKTYIRLAKMFHPDHNTNQEDRRMIELNQIYEVLSNPVKRQEYDKRFITIENFDFTKAQETVQPKRDKIIIKKGQAIKILKLLLLIVLWAIIIYIALYFIVNIIYMFINLPVWLTSLFPI